MPGRRARRPWNLLVAGVLVLGLAAGLSACGDPSDDALSPSTPVEPPAPATPETAPETPPPPEPPIPELPTKPVELGAPTASPPTNEPTATASEEAPAPAIPDAPAPEPATPEPSSSSPPTDDPLPEAALLEPWQPAIHEIATDHAALGRVQYPRSETIEITFDEAAGLFFLDVASGGIEGWLWPSQPLPSPGNRYVYLPSATRPALYDRSAEKTVTWDPAEISLVDQSTGMHPYRQNFTNALLGWGTGPDEHLVFKTGAQYAVVDASMEAVAWFVIDPHAIPHRWWAHPEGTHLLMRSVDEEMSASSLHSIDLSDGEVTTVAIPPPQLYGPYHQVHIFGAAIAVVASQPESRTCTLARYDWQLMLLSEVSVRCDESRFDLSPDGHLFAVSTVFVPETLGEPGHYRSLSATSIVDATTGAERIRVKGARQSVDTYGIHSFRSRWLADGSGLVLETHTGTRILSLDGFWGSAFGSLPGQLVPSLDDPDRLDRPLSLSTYYCRGAEATDGFDGQCRVLAARVVDGDDRELVSLQLRLRIPPGSAWDYAGAIPNAAYDRTSWGLTSDELRIHLSLGGPYEGGDIVPLLPPVIDLPPFSARPALNLAANEGCLYLREEPDRYARRLPCLPADTRVELVAPPPDSYRDVWYIAGEIVGGSWVRVRTEEGAVGWVRVDELRWAPQ